MAFQRVSHPPTTPGRERCRRATAESGTVLRPNPLRISTRCSGAVLASILLASPATAETPRPAAHHIPATVTSVYDGDTLTVVAYPWPAWSVTARVRIRGIDAPEIRGPGCDAERAGAAVARDRLAELAGERIVLVDPEYDNFGRILAELLTPAGVDIGAALVAEGHARVWAGRRESWCENLL